MKRKIWLVLPVLIIGTVAAGYFGTRYNSAPEYDYYKISPDDPAVDANLDQGWDKQARSFWYGATQGSRLLPLEWMEALEQPTSTELFMDPEHIESFNFFPRRLDVPGREKDAQLVLGMAVNNHSDADFVRTKLRWKANQTDTENWVGFTCSACHTSQINYQGHEMRIDGSGALIGFQSLLHTINHALEKTYADGPKWRRFEARVLPDISERVKYGPKLRSEFKKVLDWQKREARSNHTHVKYGFGRIDAFGHIYNKVALLLGEDEQRYNPPDAPVSIPHIWSSPQYDKVQYNGAAEKFFFWGVDVGALARNMGEFIGVFGDVVVDEKVGQEGFASSVDFKNLYALEKSVEHLRSPKWPDHIFGPHSEDEKEKEAKLVARGSELYQENCLICHDVIDRTDTTSDIYVQENYFSSKAFIAKERLKHLPKRLHEQKVARLSTDPWMACNAYSVTFKTGLWGSDNEDASVVDYASIERGDPVALGKNMEASKLLTLTVAGIMAANQNNLTEIIGESFWSMPRVPRGVGTIDTEATVVELSNAWINYDRKVDKVKRLEACMRVCFALSQAHPENMSLGYTSRPLNGIWATAPFLHNGSVPTLYDLLLPVHQRPTWFWTGSYEYDPIKVGYITNKTEENRFLFKSRVSTGGPLNAVDGNTNAGHDYNNKKYSHEDRMALIAYLKTL